MKVVSWKRTTVHQASHVDTPKNVRIDSFWRDLIAPAGLSGGFSDRFGSIGLVRSVNPAVSASCGRISPLEPKEAAHGRRQIDQADLGICTSNTDLMDQTLRGDVVFPEPRLHFPR